MEKRSRLRKEQNGKEKDEHEQAEKWKNFAVRNLCGVVLIAGFSSMVYGGPISLMCMIYFVIIKVFHEVIRIGNQHYAFHQAPWFRSFCFYFFLVSSYFGLGETREDVIESLAEHDVAGFLVHYHRMVSLALYMVGFISFILTLEEKSYKLQFIMFGWIHTTLLLVTPVYYMAIQNLFDGAVWVILPIFLVTCNDIVAFTCGFFFGRTQLIKVSPKKTWEGFIGGAIVTITLGWFVSGYLSQLPNLICPTEFRPNLVIKTICNVPPLFQLTEYTLPEFLQFLGGPFDVTQSKFQAFPFQLHCVILSLLASFIAPFGGFFASGLKRAFNVKDFGSIIPGHGGIVDRCDCNILMVMIVHVYMSTFVRRPAEKDTVFNQILEMPRYERSMLLDELQNHYNQ